MAIKTTTENFIYTVDEDTFILKIWNKTASEDALPFLEQPHNPNTGEVFTSVEDAVKYFVDTYGEQPVE